MHRTVPLACAALLAGCHRTPPTVCAFPHAAPIAHDANGDGRWDIADGVFVARSMLAGGAAVPCGPAADVDPFGVVDLSDAFASWHALFLSPIAAAPLASGACDGTTPAPEPACAPMRWRIDATAGNPFSATVSVVSPSAGIEAWSVGVRAKGCQIATATVTGTRADDGYLAKGTRKLGFEDTRVVAGGAASAVVLDWMDEVALPPSEDPQPVLYLQVVGTGASCGDCTLTLTDDLAGPAQPVATVLVASGRSYHPDLPSTTVRVCP